MLERKGKGAGLDRYQLAFGLDDANFSIADLEEGAKLFVFPATQGHGGVSGIILLYDIIW